MSEPSPAARLKVNNTSSAVNDVPSWNLTFGRRSKRHTVGLVCVHFVASAGVKTIALTPALATKWTQTSPTVWRFDLRPNVKFHDGTSFTAEDVLFTFKRAAGEGSDMKGYTNPIKEVRKLNDLTIEIETTAP